MPFDPSSSEKIDLWRLQARDCRTLAKAARSDHERDAYLTIAQSFDSLVQAELDAFEEKRDGILRGHGH